MNDADGHDALALVLLLSNCSRTTAVPHWALQMPQDVNDNCENNDNNSYQFLKLPQL